MRITQLKDVLNGTTSTTGIIDQTTGEAPVANEDLSNIVDVGKTVLEYTGATQENYDNFMRNLIDQIGKVVIVNRTYVSQAPNILKDSWEYGSVMQKVRVSIPEVRDNATWDLFNYPKSNEAYPDPFELSKPGATAKFYNSKNTYEIPITLTDYQLREAFQSAAQFGSFIAAIENRIRMKQTLCNDGLIMATIDNLIGITLSGHGGKVVNLLTAYNAIAGSPITADKALTNTEFLRFAAMTIAKYKKYVAQASAKYNAGNYITFTPADKLKFIANTEFAKAMDAYLYADTYHNEFVELNGYSEVPFWQGSGTNDDDRLSVDVVVSYPTASGTSTASVKNTGVLAVMFDDEAAAVCNENYRTTSIYNPRGEYTNYFYKYDAMFMNDVEENCVVFTIADNTEEGGGSGGNGGGSGGNGGVE